MLAKLYSISFEYEQYQKLFWDKVDSAQIRKFIMLNSPSDFTSIMLFLSNNFYEN